jgi:hypothetical protein
MAMLAVASSSVLSAHQSTVMNAVAVEQNSRVEKCASSSDCRPLLFRGGRY